MQNLDTLHLVWHTKIRIEYEQGIGQLTNVERRNIKAWTQRKDRHDVSR